MTRLLARSLLACLFSLSAISLAVAEAWPSKPIKIIVPWPPGGAADLTCRHLQQPLSDALGQPVVIENKSGGGGVTGTEALARSEADGHTIGMVISSHASNVSLHQKLPYDTLKDFKPITIVTRSPNVLSVHPSLPYKSLAELLAEAKAKPGELIYATSGNGTAQHFGGEQLKILAGVDMVHVPYRGAGPALNDLVGGQVKIGLLNLASSMPHIKGGRIRALAVTSPQRSPAAPEVPSIAESFPGFDFSEWFALVAPAGVPDDIVEKLYAAIAKAAKTPDVEAKYRDAGMTLDLLPPAKFRTLIDAEIKKFADLVKKANVRLE